jgi:putative ABC transport system substrate-binding protein
MKRTSLPLLKRRQFITLVGGAASWPFGGVAQQPAMPVIGFLRSASNAGAMHLVAAFRQGLKETGFAEGQNVAVEYCSAESQLDRLSALVAELIRWPVAVIVGNQISMLLAKAASTTIPIVLAGGSDPVRDGLVTSLNRPSGNVTGVVFFAGLLGAKRLELLHQLVPKAMTIVMLVNPNAPDTEVERRDVQAAARAIGRQLVIVDVSTDGEIETAFETFVGRKAGALFVGTGAFFNTRREQLVALAARHRLPVIYPWREAVAAGGLMSYGASITDAYRQVGGYAGRILKGEKPADLPVVRSTRFEFVINLRTARALGLDVPPMLLVLADEVIE